MQQEKEKMKGVREKFRPLTRWWKEQLPSEEVESVKVSGRLESAPCVVSSGKNGWSANMERIMMAQALSDPESHSQMRPKKTLEINPRHPINKELLSRVESGKDDEATRIAARSLFHSSLVESGFLVSEPRNLASDLHSLLSRSLNVDPDAPIDEDPAPEGSSDEL